MKNKNIIIAVVIFVVLVGAYAFFYIPLLSRIKAKSLEYAKIERDIASSRGLIESCRNMKSDFEIISEKEVSVAVDELTGHAKDLGIKFRAIKPGEFAKEDPVYKYRMLPVEMDIQASDKQFADFLGSLDELRKCLIKVESFEVTADPKNREVIIAKIVIDIYFSPETGIE